jgi:hypothetical protein
MASFQVFGLTETKTIVLTRTNVDLSVDENKLIIRSSINGDVELKFPRFHIHHGKLINYKHPQKSTTIFSKLDDIIQDLSNKKNLELTLNNAKAASNHDLFYSSDSDIIQLSLVENERVIWQLRINNLQELKHYYPYLDRWQTLVDLIVEIESLANTDVFSTQLRTVQ